MTAAVGDDLPIVFLLAGQGSHYFHMGRELFHGCPVFREWLEIGDEILRHHSGHALLDELYGAHRRLGETSHALRHTHPAIFLVQFALAKALEQRGLRPDRLIGVSLGEFVALAIAGSIPFERALRFVADQPSLFQEHCDPGAMVAVLAEPALHARSGILSSHSEVAGVMSDAQFVLSTPATALEAVIEELRTCGARHQVLAVPHAFHSRWIDQAAGAVRARCASVRLLPPRRKTFSTALQGWLNGQEHDLPWSIVRRPMDVRASLLAFEASGGARYLDLSPSGTLATVAQQIIAPGSPSVITRIMSPFGGERRVLDRLTKKS